MNIHGLHIKIGQMMILSIDDYVELGVDRTEIEDYHSKWWYYNIIDKSIREVTDYHGICSQPMK